MLETCYYYIISILRPEKIRLIIRVIHSLIGKYHNPHLFKKVYFKDVK
jgi:hypothetical protein